MATVISLPSQTMDAIYETPLYHQCWWQYLAPKFNIRHQYRDLLIYRKPVLKPLVFLNEMRVAGWNNALDQDMTLERVTQFEHFAKTVSWDYFRMTTHQIRQSPEAIAALERLGYPVIQAHARPQYVVDLTQGWDLYFKTRSQNMRKDMRRKLNRAEKAGAHLIRYEGPAGFDEFFTRFFAAHIPYWDAKTGYSYFNDRHEREFLMAWARELDQTGQVILDSLVMDDQIVNLCVSVLHGDSLYWVLTINTGDLLEHSPGLIGLWLRLQQAEQAGFRYFRMGQGDYRYKIQAANRVENCHTLLVTNPQSLPGQWYVNRLVKRMAALDTPSA